MARNAITYTGSIRNTRASKASIEYPPSLLYELRFVFYFVPMEFIQQIRVLLSKMNLILVINHF